MNKWPKWSNSIIDCGYSLSVLIIQDRVNVGGTRGVLLRKVWVGLILTRDCGKRMRE